MKICESKDAMADMLQGYQVLLHQMRMIISDAESNQAEHLSLINSLSFKTETSSI